MAVVGAAALLLTVLAPAAGAQGSTPGAPGSVTAVAGEAAATVSWQAPSDQGSSPATSYVVTASPGAETVTTTGPWLTATVTGLSNGTPYTFTVAAVNGSGPGPASTARVPWTAWPSGSTATATGRSWSSSGTARRGRPSPPDGPGAISGSLSEVSCLSASSCTAVGSYNNPTPGVTLELIERWDGSSWSTVPGGEPQQGNNLGTNFSLSGVWCQSSTFCVAVGTDATNSEVHHAIREQWNGTSWSVVSGPFNDEGDSLASVSCSSAADCTAVGQLSGGGALVEHWNGTAWSTAPNPAPLGSGLHSVSCAGSPLCVAVGYRVLERNTGAGWEVDTYPSGTPSGPLNGVACADSRDCLATGSALDPQYPYLLVLSYATP